MKYDFVRNVDDVLLMSVIQNVIQEKDPKYEMEEYT